MIHSPDYVFTVLVSMLISKTHSESHLNAINKFVLYEFSASVTRACALRGMRTRTYLRFEHHAVAETKIMQYWNAKNECKSCAFSLFSHYIRKLDLIAAGTGQVSRQVWTTARDYWTDVFQSIG